MPLIRPSNNLREILILLEPSKQESINRELFYQVLQHLDLGLNKV